MCDKEKMANILVVDDEENIREVLNELLKGSGYTVFLASNVKDAEDTILSNKIDLVITDIMMPDTNGLQLVLRAKFVNPYVKFIVMTGYHEPENITFCFSNDVSRYVKKPFHLDDILSIIKEVLEEEKEKTVQTFEKNVDGWLEVSLYSTEESVMATYNYLKQYLAEYIGQEAIVQLSLSFYEMLRNAIEWGNKMDKKKVAQIGCMFLKDRIIFKIQDEGSGFDVVKAVNPEKDPFKRQELRANAGKRPGGYGIEIVKKSMDEFFYNEKGNCLIMTKYINTK